MKKSELRKIIKEVITEEFNPLNFASQQLDRAENMLNRWDIGESTYGDTDYDSASVYYGQVETWKNVIEMLNNTK